MRRFGAAVLAAVLSGCGTLPTSDDGVAFLQVQLPPSLSVPVGGTLQFQAQALDETGAPLPDIVIHWRTADVTITVGETTGLVTGVSAGTGRIQAFLDGDEFVSDFIEVTVTPAPAASRR